jgi:hypothetical protein
MHSTRPMRLWSGTSPGPGGSAYPGLLALPDMAFSIGHDEGYPGVTPG